MIEDDLLAADRQLYPTGRAFIMPQDGTMEALHIALNKSQLDAYLGSLSLFSGVLPDNENFTSDDCLNWERIFGLINNTLLPVQDRRDALLQRLSSVNANRGRQHYMYIQGQLQKAGFNVFVYENIFDDGFGGFETRTPYEVSLDPTILTDIQYGDIQYGDNQYGQIYKIKLANYIDEKDDYYFNLAGDLSATFFVGGATLGSSANVDIARHDEFRQLLLTLKPATTVGFLFINYV